MLKVKDTDEYNTRNGIQKELKSFFGGEKSLRNITTMTKTILCKHTICISLNVHLYRNIYPFIKLLSYITRETI
jgi:hypothetical protein